jgi:anti-sigma factor RsiW
LTRWITCLEFVEFLDAYLAGELPPEQVAEFNNHLAGCPPCVTYMQTYQETVRLGKEALRTDDESLLAEVPEKLVEAILASRSKPPS